VSSKGAFAKVCLFCAYTLAISRIYSQLAAKDALNSNSVICSKLQLVAEYVESSQKALLSALGAGGRWSNPAFTKM
jgi:hypothetical protein